MAAVNKCSLPNFTAEAEWHWQNELSRGINSALQIFSTHSRCNLHSSCCAIVRLDNFADAMEVITDSTPTFQQQNWHWQIMLGDRQKFSMLSNTVNRGVFNLHQCARQCTRILQMWSEWSLLLSAYNACNWTLDSEQCIVLTLKTQLKLQLHAMQHRSQILIREDICVLCFDHIYHESW